MRRELILICIFSQKKVSFGYGIGCAEFLVCMYIVQAFPSSQPCSNICSACGQKDWSNLCNSDDSIRKLLHLYEMSSHNLVELFYVLK